jgi:glycosyltransferase involved in cell wall biosynthesis
LLYNLASKLSETRSFEVSLYSIESNRLHNNSLRVSLPLETTPFKVRFLRLTNGSNSLSKASSLVADFAYWKLDSFKKWRVELLCRRIEAKPSLHTLVPVMNAIARETDIIHVGSWRSSAALALNFLANKGKMVHTYCHLLYHPFQPKGEGIPPFVMKAWEQIGAVALIDVADSFETLTVSTPYEEQLLRNLGIRNVKFLGEGIDLTFVESVREAASREGELMRQAFDHEYLVLFIGPKVERKGFHHLIKAVSAIRKKDKVDLALVTIGPQESVVIGKELRAAYHSLQLEHALFEYTHVDEFQKFAIISAVDLIAIPSLYETVPLAFLEAWALNKPTIGALIPSVYSVTGDTASLLVPYGDVDAIRGAILRLLHDKKLASSLGDRGREKVDKIYNLKMMVYRLLRIYKDSMGL